MEGTIFCLIAGLFGSVYLLKKEKYGASIIAILFTLLTIGYLILPYVQ